MSVGVVIDTSASMSDRFVKQALSEVSVMIRNSGVPARRVTFVTVDTECSAPQIISHVSQLDIIGGGGTDMRVGIDFFLDSAKHHVDVVVVLTDGETDWHDVPVGMPVIAGILSKPEDSYPQPPEWMTTVHIPVREFAEAAQS